MCGITGFYDLKASAGSSEIQRNIEKMTSAIAHRGPDSAGFWLDQDTPLALGHRRLAIVDLSPSGHQPMTSASGRYVIVFNGEVYNFQGLRRELEDNGLTFRGHSDTEVLLAGIENWGLEITLEKCNGMFAFALWDTKAKILHLIRDRVGKKPLYFGILGKKFVFCSELKALHALTSERPEIDRNSIALFLQHNYVPSPWSIYKGIYKLPPGHMASFPLEKISGASDENLFRFIEPFWTARTAALQALEHPLEVSEQAALDLLDDVVTKAVTGRMVADVPLGAFLSGGIDSSLVVSIMARNSDLPPQTFSIGYDEVNFNEAHYAHKIARHLGTNHTEFYLRPDDALSLLDRLPEIYDEPFADSSQIPTLQVSELARKHVTVALSGDGGDELFFGYRRYEEAMNLHRTLCRIPVFTKPLLGQGLRALSEEGWNSVFSVSGLSKISKHFSGNRMHGLAAILGLQSELDVYGWLMSNWKNPYAVINEAAPRNRFFSAYDIKSLPVDFASGMMLHDFVNYLPEDNLVKVDRASMAHALEVRCPLLDYQVAELAWRMPKSLKYKNGRGKYILRKLLERYLPLELFDRPKQGFSVPVGNWLRGPLKDWGETLLAEQRLRNEGFFNPAPIRKKWQEHQAGTHDWHPHLWNILMFQVWYERWHK